MSRGECEQAIREKLIEIRDIYKQYNPDGDYLELCLMNGNISFFNEHWDKDSDNRIAFFEEGEKDE